MDTWVQFCSVTYAATSLAAMKDESVVMVMHSNRMIMQFIVTYLLIRVVYSELQIRNPDNIILRRLNNGAFIIFQITTIVGIVKFIIIGMHHHMCFSVIVDELKKNTIAVSIQQTH